VKSNLRLPLGSLPGRIVIPALVLLLCAPAFADDPDNCLLCHRYRGLSRLEGQTSKLHIFFVDPEYTVSRRGAHSRLGCTDCHERAEVSVIPHKTVTPVDCARQCHLGSPSGFARTFNHANIPRMLSQSVHTADTLKKAQTTGGALLESGQSECLYCHDEPSFRDPTRAIPSFSAVAPRVFDRCEICHAEKVPADIEYYFQHIASRLQPARPPVELAQVCAVCHSDPTFMKATELPDTVTSFMRSFHGKAALLGEETTANCLSCHVTAGENVHLMLGPKNPRSSVNEQHIADSCRSSACHPGADKSIAATSVHLDLPTSHGTPEFLLALAFIVLTLLTFGPSAALVLLDLFQVTVGPKHHAETEAHHVARRLLRTPAGREQLKRFTISQRFQHWLLALLFILLVLTGFPMKFADRSWARSLVMAFGGLQAARRVHHWAGLALLISLVGHLVYVAWGLRRHARSRTETGEEVGYLSAFISLPMWITPTDVRKTMQLLAHLLFLRKDKPSFGRFSPTEKFEYLGVFWGTILLGMTGILLWGAQITTHFLSGRVFNIATIAHTYEAFLAAIHVGILHIYNVILAPKVFPLSLATLTGDTPIEKLVEEHSDMVDEVAHRINPPEMEVRE